MRRQKKKAFISNPLANATGKQFVDSGKKFTLEKGSLVKITKPYKPEQCGIYKLPKYFLPDVETAAPYRKNKAETVMKLFEKYPSLDYVSAYHFSTKDSEVNKEVWRKFLSLYEQGYIKRIYNKINGYFETELPNYTRKNNNTEYFKAGATAGKFLYEIITEEITTRIGFESSAEKQKILLQLIYDYIYTPETLFEAMYDNAREFLIDEVKKIDLTITGIKEDPAIPSWQTNKNNKTILMGMYYGTIGSVFDSSLAFNQVIHRDIKKENDKKILYTVALKDNLQQLQVSTKSISQSENEDGRENGDYPQGGGDEDAGGGGNNGKNSDKTMLLFGVGILAAIFVLKRYKR